MPKQVDAPAPYLVTVIDGYRKNLAQTGAAIGQAVFWLSLISDRQDADDNPLRDLARELHSAQTALALVNDSLLAAVNIIDRETKQ